MKRFLTTLTTLIALTTLTAVAQVPASVKRAASQAAQAPTLKVECTINAKPAEMIISGNCFSMKLQGASIHFDGTTQWAYNAADGEVTVIEPTPEELAQTNPIGILRSLEELFNGAAVKGQPNTVRLTPKAKDSDIAEVTVTFNPTTGWPTAMTVISSSGRADIAALKFSPSKTKTDPSAFKFKAPKGTTITDLR